MNTFKPLALTLALAAAGVVHATPLATNTFTTSVATTATFFGGTLLDAVETNISNLSYNGIARAAVYDTGTGLDFYYQFTNNPSSVNGVERFTGYNYLSLDGSVVDVFQTSAAFGIFLDGTESADGADRTSLGVIGFSFVPNGQSKINPGTTSFTEIVRTSARDYVVGSFGLLDGIGDNAEGFAPAVVSAVPEPETYALMLAGLCAVCWISRRRSHRSGSAQS